MAKKAKKGNAAPEDVTGLLRLPQGPVDLSAYDPRATPGFGGDKDAGKVALAERGPRLADLQERLFAHGRTGGKQRVLLVVQGMDSSGKGGTIRHVVGQVDPQGVAIRSFRAPTKEELAHDFLWRCHAVCPQKGQLTVFNRSHYEDVLVVKLLKLVSDDTIKGM